MEGPINVNQILLVMLLSFLYPSVWPTKCWERSVKSPAITTDFSTSLFSSLTLCFHIFAALVDPHKFSIPTSFQQNDFILSLGIMYHQMVKMKEPKKTGFTFPIWVICKNIYVPLLLGPLLFIMHYMTDFSFLQSLLYVILRALQASGLHMTAYLFLSFYLQTTFISIFGLSNSVCSCILLSVCKHKLTVCINLSLPTYIYYKMNVKSIHFFVFHLLFLVSLLSLSHPVGYLNIFHNSILVYL